ncbi:MAG: DUF1028 domain-containing protein [Saprospiraceae bacterium]
MKKFFIFSVFCFLTLIVNAQDTFSIVAVDPETGEVGSAGASCVELVNFGLPPDFLGVLFPGIGAINTQAWYSEQNQNNASARMEAGDSPQEIIDWLVANDFQNNPTLRQYGIVRLENGEASSAAHTGVNTDDFKAHRTGPTYSIQGNILLDSTILINMENNFLATEGTLAEKLMAAMQGANVVGADSRCADNGTSSLFAFLKVAQPNDEMGNPSLVLGMETNDGDGIEPIDSLQNLFDAAFPSSISNLEYATLQMEIYPQPAANQVTIELTNLPDATNFRLQLFDSVGKLVASKEIKKGTTVLNKSEINSANLLFWYQLNNEKGSTLKSGKIIFQ